MKRKTIFNYSLVVVAFFAACHISRKNVPPIAPQPETFDTEGHRGARGLAPENTWPAFRTALDLGVTTLEMDAVITADKKVVLSHEPFFNHEISTHPDGKPVTEAEEKQLNIFKMPYAEVARFDVGMRPHPRFPQQAKMKATKPLLADIIDSVRQYMMVSRRPFPYYNIETKTQPSTDNIYHPEPAEFVELLMNVIKEKQIEEQVIIQSFDFRTLQYLHKHYPAIKTAMLIEDNDPRDLTAQLKALGFTPYIYSPAYKRVTKELVEECHALQMRIVPWTVNTREEISQLKALGVSGIISDYPDLF
ncbi:glycerophosphodiester phosphodiesterase family protein [Terrimonas ferruginea]|uniref:glycerophosphodiester phosphodiesterase family protein n=1 Tax=Terrimonas ferruginea TaxID=249 RepID=UPI0004029D09|nr:glycerophosphodiester phosphodiesterase family protein [Terrimonas ferruginea]